ncbi:hypothetical protein CQW23_30147 [Capsicum baccatum]|uniref:DUF1985 domain-containing protein n=1 Tax=Capsicum baccatum TaxID=33114 RepID=A0A2G2VBG9_CAPBA|nr:hypothetical protein CQW23_30147 [Capsicum baccatum]
MYAETDNDRDDVFIVNINCSELHFGEREFAAITGLKYCDESDFVEDFNTRSKLIDVYFNTTNADDGLRILGIPNETKVKLSQPNQDDNTSKMTNNFDKLCEEVIQVREDLKNLQNRVDVQFSEMKTYMDDSIKKILIETSLLMKKSIHNLENEDPVWIKWIGSTLWFRLDNLWETRRKQDNDAISEREVTGNFIKKHGGLTLAKESATVTKMEN